MYKKVFIKNKYKENKLFNMKRLHLIVHGRVQSVGFRYFTARNAKKLDLKGLVRNLRDGTVEMIAEGDESKLKQLLTYCKEGPWFANVSKVEENWSKSKEEFESFNIKYF